MTKPSQLLPSIVRNLRRTVLPLTILCVVPMLAVRPAQAQNFSVIHAFTRGADGAFPYASLTLGGGETLYGTTLGGGGVNGRGCEPQTAGCGVVFKMTLHNGEWVLAPLYAFNDFDGAGPMAPVVFGPGNLLYGSTINGGNNLNCFEDDYGCGVIFTLQPPPTACHSALCYWIETPIYVFGSPTVGFEPMGNLAFDQAGNVYGTTFYGGNPACRSQQTGCGNVFQLTQSGPTWTETTVYDFAGGSDGVNPSSGLVVDSMGNLYGTVEGGGAHGYGAVFELTLSVSGWTKSLIYSFQEGNDGGDPVGGLVMDAAGNLYGTTIGGGASHGGAAFELSHSGGGWTFSVIASLSGVAGSGPRGSLAFDSMGNLYGTTWGEGMYGYGNVFKLTQSGGQWTYRDLYDFTGGNDGGLPEAGPTVDASGNIYGTTPVGGLVETCEGRGCGVVWEITP